MTREYGDYVQDIIGSIDKAMKFVENMTFDQFVEDDKTIFAVTRAIEIIGEAVKNIPDEVKLKHPEIPWREIAGTRDKIAHEYFGVDLEIIWNVIKERVPGLKENFKKIMDELQ